MPYSCDLVNGRVIEVFEDMIRRLARLQWRSVTFGGPGASVVWGKIGAPRNFITGNSSGALFPWGPGLPQMVPRCPLRYATARLL